MVKHLADSTWVGCPPNQWSSVRTIRFVIYDAMKQIKTKKSVVSSKMTAHGHLWRIKVSKSNGCLYVRLKSKTYQGKLKCKIRLNGKEKKDRTKISLNRDKSLVIEVDLVVKCPNVWYPKKLKQNDVLLDLYQDATSETADVFFDVAGTKFFAHRSILFLRAKPLHELCEDHSSILEIANVSVEVFKTILDFLYSVKVPTIENEDVARETLVAANRFGCIGLKLYVESVIVDKLLTEANAARMLLLADSCSNALLKEAALRKIIQDPVLTRQSDDWSKVEESRSLVLDILRQTATKTVSCRISDFESKKNQVDFFDVTSLRNILGESNLDVDGSREILVARLKNHVKNEHSRS